LGSTFSLHQDIQFKGSDVATEQKLTTPHAPRRREIVRADAVARAGAVVVACWCLLEVLVAVQFALTGSAPPGADLLDQLRRTAPLRRLLLLHYWLSTIVVGCILYRCLNPNSSRVFRSAVLVFATTAATIATGSHPAPLEAILGALGGLGTSALLVRWGSTRAQVIALPLCLLHLVIAAVWHASPVPAYVGRFHWNLSAGSWGAQLGAWENVAAEAWISMALGFLCMSLWPRLRVLTAPVGAVLIGSSALTLEWFQRLDQSRSGEVMDVLLSVLAWLVPCALLTRLKAEPRTGRRETRRRKGRRRVERPWLPGAAAILLATVAAGWFGDRQAAPAETARAQDAPTLPPPEEYPPANLAQFRTEHPRLPVPSASEIRALRERTPAYLETRAVSADGGKGELQAAIFTAYVDPNSIDLQALLSRLLDLDFGFRGDEQTRTLALAYDWLYSQWTPAQRQQLLDKTNEACHHQIGVITIQQLSPYAVALYGGPLQALMACAIATYGDALQSAPIMNFTASYWRDTVLPVWQQVMGTTGGWHEGMEYLGLGIGQAVYRVPAMWRRATREDVFANNPGLRGFLDFLFHRVQPDGKVMNWGDGKRRDGEVPDRLALALEYRHAAAYSVGGCPRNLTPTSWPWGPLTDSTLCDPEAGARLPLTARFDGIGMVVARSDHSADATYVTFKAGDNFWSHGHLDQGAFTIFKSRPLAIDSGFSGPSLGSDHHLNYAYQTIAHNLVTITDPLDIAQAKTKDGYRHIANDGGQRRIGSAWRLDSAPRNREDWYARRKVFHTATMLNYATNDYATVATADLTAAYNNEDSGTGDFSSRTKRVKHYRRTFAYDRRLDAVIVYDSIVTTAPEFHVRWLLHTIDKPKTSRRSFEMALLERDGPDGASGLQGFVPLPVTRTITAVGGPGSEFLVDGRNYDENGTLQHVLHEQDEQDTGEWRVEIESGALGYKHEFLVFLFPWSDGRKADVDVECQDAGKTIDCRVDKERQVSLLRIVRASGAVELTE